MSFVSPDVLQILQTAFRNGRNTILEYLRKRQPGRRRSGEVEACRLLPSQHILDFIPYMPIVYANGTVDFRFLNNKHH
jgi:hypothetical protein